MVFILHETFFISFNSKQTKLCFLLFVVSSSIHGAVDKFVCWCCRCCCCFFFGSFFYFVRRYHGIRWHRLPASLESWTLRHLRYVRNRKTVVSVPVPSPKKITTSAPSSVTGFTEFPHTGRVWLRHGLEFHLVLPRSTRFYWVLLGFTGFYWALLGFTGFYWALLGFTGYYGVLLALSGFLLGFTGFY